MRVFRAFCVYFFLTLPLWAQEPVSIEAAAGGGFPARFSGDFSLARQGDASFTFHFFHQTINALLHDAAPQNGANENLTALDGSRRFVFGAVTIDADARYQIGAKDLQGQSAAIQDITRQFIFGNIQAAVTLPEGFSLSASTGVSDVSRRAGLIRGWTPGIEGGASIRKIPAELFFQWQNESCRAVFGGRYHIEQYDGDKLIIAHNGGSFASFNTDWGIWRAGADAGVFFENSQAVFPFALGIEVLPLLPGGQEASFSAHGGLMAQSGDFAAFEKANPFTQAREPLHVSSDWFFGAEAFVPLNEYFRATASLSFRQTAFGRGVPASDFSARHPGSGLFSLAYRSRTALDTALAVGANRGMLNADLSWGAFWLDSAANGELTAKTAAAGWDEFSYERIFAPQYPLSNQQQPHHHCVSLNLSLVPKSGKWGAHADTQFFISEWDTPFITLGAFYRFGQPEDLPSSVSGLPQVSLAVEIQDAVKFITAEERIYAGPYTASAGSISVFLRFVN